MSNLSAVEVVTFVIDLEKTNPVDMKTSFRDRAAIRILYSWKEAFLQRSWLQYNVLVPHSVVAEFHENLISIQQPALELPSYFSHSEALAHYNGDRQVYYELVL